MNKKLLAAALGVAFTAPVFADASNLTLYGRLHTVLDHQSTDTAGGATTGGNFTMQSASSRVGIKGSEDLGGGLKVLFGWEVQISSDANDNGGAGVNGNTGAINDGRHVYVGFGTSYGKFVAGTQDGGNDTVAPMYNLNSAFSGGLNNNGGPLTQVSAALGSGATGLTGNQRRNNSLGYSGKFGGVAVEVRHAMNGTDDEADNIGANNAVTTKENGARETEVAAKYNIGDLMIGAAYFNDDRQDSQTPVAATPTIEDAFTIGGVYKIGALKLGLGIQTIGYYNQVGNDDSETRYAVSATYNLGGGSNVYGLIDGGEDLDNGFSAANNTPAVNTDIQRVQIAYSYDFSKRTRVYAGFQRLNSEPTAGGADTDTDNITFGLRHNF